MREGREMEGVKEGRVVARPNIFAYNRPCNPPTKGAIWG